MMTAAGFASLTKSMAAAVPAKWFAMIANKASKKSVSHVRRTRRVGRSSLLMGVTMRKSDGWKLWRIRPDPPAEPNVAQTFLSAVSPTFLSARRGHLYARQNCRRFAGWKTCDTADRNVRKQLVRRCSPAESRSLLPGSATPPVNNAAAMTNANFFLLQKLLPCGYLGFGSDTNGMSARATSLAQSSPGAVTLTRTRILVRLTRNVSHYTACAPRPHTTKG